MSSGKIFGSTWGPWIDRTHRKHIEFVKGTVLENVSRAWVNNVYIVQLYVNPSSWGEIKHLHVHRIDGKPIRSWSDMQRIKDELIGPEFTAVEVYPARSDLVDTVHAYHLWVLPKEVKLPFGLHLNAYADPRERHDKETALHMPLPPGMGKEGTSSGTTETAQSAN
jgi:hypothetical protein